MVPIEIPRSLLTSVVNDTAWRTFSATKMAVGRRFHDVLVVKASFSLAPGPLSPSDDQARIELADDMFPPAELRRGELRTVEASEALGPWRSVRTPGDVHLPKPGTDVIVTGHARQATPTTSWLCSVRVSRAGETLLSHTARATGPRVWTRAAGDWLLTQPVAVREVPIRYELVFGGSYRRVSDDPSAEAYELHEENPVGVGFVGEEALQSNADLPAPQWEPPDHPIRKPNRPVPLTGFGPVARPWLSRLRHAGTYDDAWLARARADRELGLPPDYPRDFSSEFFQCAHPDLRARGPLRAGDEVELVGFWATKSGEATGVKFCLPRVRPSVAARLADGTETSPPVVLDLVHVDLETERVHLVWRSATDLSAQTVAVSIQASEEPS